MSRANARRGTFDRHARRHARPQLEGLEQRLLLYATTGGLWSHPARITFSFVPDGTNVGGTPSNLFAKFNSVAPTQTWQNIFLKAAAYWESYANINLVQVSDSGVPVGGTYYQQGDPNNGDIRIGGYPQAMGTLAFAILPPPMNGGSAAGDIFFNTSQQWQINTNYDIMTVALHEFGHALGLDHSTTTTADMYAYYNGFKQYPTTDDVAGIQAIYGARQPDAFSGLTLTGNYTSATATDTSPYLNPGSSQMALYYLDLQGPSYPEWFKVTVPSTTNGTMVATMQSTNLSELSPRVQVYNSSVWSLGYATAPSTYGSTVSVTITGVAAGQVYYIKAAAAGDGPTQGGNYGLLVNFGSTIQWPIGPPNTYVANAPDRGGGGVAEGSGNGADGQGGGHSHGRGDGSRDEGDTLVMCQETVIFDTLRILPTGGQSNAGVSISDESLLIAPSPQAHDVALGALADDQSWTKARGRGGSQAVWLPRILTLG
jgi:hypothetical protein